MDKRRGSNFSREQFVEEKRRIRHARRNVCAGCGRWRKLVRDERAEFGYSLQCDTPGCTMVAA